MYCAKGIWRAHLDAYFLRAKFVKSENRHTKFSSLDVLAAFVFEIIAAVPLGMLAYFYLVGEIESSLRIVILAALGASIGALLCIVFFRVVLKKLTGTEEPSLVTVIVTLSIRPT